MYNPIIIQRLIVFILILWSMQDNTNSGCDVLSYRATLLLMCLQQDPMSNSLAGPNNEPNDNLNNINLYDLCVVFSIPSDYFSVYVGLRKINLEISDGPIYK